MPKLSILDEIPTNSTCLKQGQKLGEVAARVGFDWPTAKQALAKVYEELAELEELLDAHEAHEDAITDELGDILFAVANVARKLGVDAEEAMQHTNRKFRRRFGFIEAEVRRQGAQFDELDLDAMEELWQKAKEG